ncbi:hypothetical protein [Mycobacterium sp. JS623]|uniref:hypothetical protein n=1 Tax=Mycobacterium sp. JS623 TaxID=212767 RepID=UPI0002F615BA|nr:hypothetical protein [Mycobacterium sp. JS623]
MGAIEPVDLPETALIIGEHFPVQDETAYAREAQVQRRAAEQAAGAGGVALAAAGYTEPEFRGLAGGALATKLAAHHHTLTADEARHLNVAAWLDSGGENIGATKSQMNQISADYHAAYDQLCDRAVAESWPQQKLRQTKDELVAEAQERIRSTRSAFQDRHSVVANGIVSGDSPDETAKKAAAGAPTVLSAGWQPAPMSPQTTTDPSLPPLLPPAPAQSPGTDTPQYPPYVPESQFPNGLTRDAIEKQGHDDVVMWSPTPEQPLPPYWMNRYMEISPGVWVPDDRPSPPGSVHPA